MLGTLVVAPTWIGDALMAQPLLARLREREPRPRIEVLAPAWVASVLKRMPEVDEVIESPFDHGHLEIGARRKLGKSLRARGYDEAIVLPNTWKSALVPVFARIPRRSGYVGEVRYGLLNVLHRPARGERESMARHYVRLAEAPGGDPPEPLPPPRLRLRSDEAARTAQRFGFEPAPHRNAVFCPGAEYGQAKRWPAEHYAALARALKPKGDGVWLLGSRNENGAPAPGAAPFAGTDPGRSTAMSSSRAGSRPCSSSPRSSL